ncbi:MAG: insulinase family protein, partial [Prolixibacteraceae bacterium]|nr:insulinase family protein [Prolixibacteraceae bacterium]
MFTTAVLGVCSCSDKYTINNIYHGFKLVEKRFVNEVNADCYYFIHEKTGARLLKIAANDRNKMFDISFKTIPENDFGTPHILEHSVLNGSENFPVKSPFDVLQKGSLNTYLNAFTSADFTTYPAASMNMKDYFNLMHVYLDAVFNPLIITDERIMKQEGWHYELENREAPLTIKGVVYSEMKGVYSDPSYELYDCIGRYLFPDNTYGVSSGGHPDEIPNLTQDYFTAFHRKFYHPSNSYIFLYGDAELERELEFIDGNYLSKYSRSEDLPTVAMQKAFDKMKTVEKKYPVSEGSPLTENTWISLSYVVGTNNDRFTTMAMGIIASAMINHESAPLRLALQEAGIGKDVMGWFLESQQNIFSIVVQNANPEDVERCREVIESTLRNVAENGFDKAMLEGIINRTEFALKEGDTPHKGIMYLDMISQSWINTGDPFAGLEFEKPLAELKKSLTSNMLEDIIKEYLLVNPHSLLLTLNPEPGLQARRDARLAQKLADYKAALTAEEIDKLVEETQSLIEYQQREDSPEALATIPMLQLSDIQQKVKFAELDKLEIKETPFMYNKQFTNGIIYSDLYFDMLALPQEKIQYASLLSALLGKLDTENYSYGNLDNDFNIHTGGYSCNLSTFLERRFDKNLAPRFVVSSKATSDKAGKMAELIAELLLRTRFDDKERMQTVLVRHQAQLDAAIRQEGMNYAVTRTTSYYTNRGMFNELVSGVEYFRFVTALVRDFDRCFDEVSRELSEICRILFDRSNLTGLITCSAENLNAYSEAIQKTLEQMPTGDAKTHFWNFEFNKGNEAILSASQVQYVVKGYDFKRLGFGWNGKMKVLSQILNTDWLQTQVRVIGGAYGGFCSFNAYGGIYFASYRDPNLKETLDIFDATA